MTENNNITILYEIKGIRPSIRKNGYVEVLMSPVDKWNENEKNDLPIKITGIGPDGGMLPPEIMNQMNQLMRDALPPHMRQIHEKDPRTLLHVESEIEFMARGWKYGDTISITLEKIDANNIDNEKQ